MSRKFIASVLAASLAITSVSAMPARADGDNLVKFLAGATALVIIGKAIDENRNRRHQETQNDRNNPRHHHDDRNYERDHGNRYHYNNRAHPPSRAQNHHYRQHNVLPRRCKESVYTPEGTRNYMNGYCLQKNFDHSARLPNQCRVTVLSRHREKSGYSIRCLNRQGYRISER